MTTQSIPQSTAGPYIAGDTLFITLQITDDNDDPINLTEADVVFTVARYRGGETVIKKTDGDGITFVDAVNGKVEIRVDGGDTEPLGSPCGEAYPYDVAVIDSAGDRYTTTTGEWTITAPAREADG